MKNKIDPAITAEDLIKCGYTPKDTYIASNCKVLLKGFDPTDKEFIAKAKNCTLRLEQPSEELEKFHNDIRKRSEVMGHIDVVLTEAMRQLSHRCTFGEINLIYGHEVISAIQIEFVKDAERK